MQEIPALITDLTIILVVAALMSVFTITINERTEEVGRAHV